MLFAISPSLNTETTYNKNDISIVQTNENKMKYETVSLKHMGYNYLLTKLSHRYLDANLFSLTTKVMVYIH